MGRKRKRTRGRGESGTISRRTLLLLLGGGTVGATGLVSTGAFDSVAGDRLFGVETAGDDTALLGVDIEERTGRTGDTITLLELTNRFEEPLETISAELTQSDQRILGDIRTPNRLEPGETGAIEAVLSCSKNRTEDLDISISARSPNESVTADRSVRVTCLAEQPVCAPRDIPGCIDSAFPEPPERQTDCSVVINTGGDDYEKSVFGNTSIGGALEINAAETELSLGGSVSINDHVRIESGGEIDFDIGGAATVGGVLQFDTPDELDVDIGRDVGGGLCANTGDSIEFEISGGSTLDGEASLTTNDQVTLDVIRGSTIDGGVTIDGEDEVELTIDGDSTTGRLEAETSDEVTLDITGGSEIAGSADISSGDEVAVTLDGDERIDGNLTIDAGGEVSVDLSGSSEITGDVSITTADEVEVTLSGASSIAGDVSIESEDEVEVTIDGSSSIDGNVTVSGTEEVSVSDCSAVGGTVTPQSAC